MSRSSLDETARRPHLNVSSARLAAEKAPYTRMANGRVQLHLFLDRSVVELFINGRDAVISRIYPTRADSQAIWLFATGGEMTVRRLDIWQLASVWPTVADDLA